MAKKTSKINFFRFRLRRVKENNITYNQKILCVCSPMALKLISYFTVFFVYIFWFSVLLNIPFWSIFIGMCSWVTTTTVIVIIVVVIIYDVTAAHSITTTLLVTVHTTSIVKSYTIVRQGNKEVVLTGSVRNITRLVYCELFQTISNDVNVKLILYWSLLDF